MRGSLLSKLVAAWLLALGLDACQAVAGIEERKLDPDANAPVISKQCKDYCSVVMQACTGENAVYTTEEVCLGVCSQLDPGDSEDTQGVNTVACRAFQANQAKDEPAGYCKGAGPGGGDICGSDCETYCQVYPTVCPKAYEYESSADCLKVCGALPDQATFDVVADHGGDTIECRLVHMSSATLKPEEHCAHATLRPSEPWCIGAADEAPTCKQYCDIALAACQGDVAQYESPQQCLDVCAALDPGKNDDKTGNSVACRRYHSFNASVGPAEHCSHTGPTGDGHCGDHGSVEDGHTGNCESYCKLVATACPDEFDTALGSAEECMETCVTCRKPSSTRNTRWATPPRATLCTAESCTPFAPSRTRPLAPPRLATISASRLCVVLASEARVPHRRGSLHTLDAQDDLGDGAADDRVANCGHSRPR